MPQQGRQLFPARVAHWQPPAKPDTALAPGRQEVGKRKKAAKPGGSGRAA
jgi:hypothetical protein